jgi:hypothetical protein
MPSARLAVVYFGFIAVLPFVSAFTSVSHLTEGGIVTQQYAPGISAVFQSLFSELGNGI